jgi:heat shock protein HtpX
MTTVAVVVGLLALASDIMLRFTWYGSGARRSNKSKGGGAAALVILVIAILFIVLTPIIASAMRFAISRQREYLADASGALLCRNPDALADALEKISNEHQSFLNGLFATHPPVEERIKLLRAM